MSLLLLVLLLCTTTTVSIPPTSDPSSHHSADATRPQGSSLSVPFAPTPCPPGTYTEHDDVPPNVCRACPAGRYGADYDMQDARCSGPCDRGHWCPQGSTSARARPCPAGRFGSTLGATTSSCTGVCKEGYYCPERSVSDAHQRCGAVHLYCPRGSALPVQVSPGHYTTGGNSATQDLDDGKASGPNHHGDNDEYTRTGQRLCEPGHYCGAVNSLNAYPGGVRRDCPRGTYGSQYGLETVGCSGSCPKGHYCPTRTIKPTNCPAGTYGTVADAGRTRNVTWTGDPVIELASPLNVVTITVGLDEARCSGWCALGHYCPPASVVATQIQCPAGRYGNVTGLRTSECSPHCSGQNDAGEAVGNGHGVVAFPLSYKCPAGDASLCEPGYYCPMGSTSSQMVPCGGSTLYCPRASSVPTPVSVGYYTVPLGPNRATNRSSQLECPRGSYCIGGIRALCPAGTYGATTGLSTSDCSGPCTPGHWCKEGAWDRQENACGGTHLYCPEGSPLPVPVSVGYHTTNGPPLRRSNQTICTPGSWCDPFGVRRLCPAGSYGNIHGMLEGCEAPCPKGSYCTIGSMAPVPCPAGRFGDRTNLTTVDCSGRCYEGYYCDVGSPSATQHECGDEKYICPVGSGPTGSGAPQERTLRLYSGAGGVECDPDASFYGECPSNTIESSHSSYSYGDDRFDPYANMPAGWVA